MSHLRFKESILDGEDAFVLTPLYRDSVVHRLDDLQSDLVANIQAKLASRACKVRVATLLYLHAKRYGLVLFKAVWTGIYDLAAIVVNSFHYGNAHKWIAQFVVNLFALPVLMVFYTLTEPLIFLLQITNGRVESGND